MAREHAQVKLSMWDDDDVRDLSPAAQHLYFVLMTSPSLSYCGVADWRPKRLAALAKGWTAAHVVAAAIELRDALFIVVDEDTEEVLIRSWVRNDGLMAREKMGTAMASAHALISSKTLRGVVVHELCRLHEEQPGLLGFRSAKAASLIDKEAIDASEVSESMPLGMAFGMASGEPQPSEPMALDFDPLLLAPSSLLLAPAPSSAANPAAEDPGSGDPASEPSNVRAIRRYDYTPEFDEAWKLYERKGDKARAFAEWKAATSRASSDVILAAIPGYIASEPVAKFRKDFERWLKGDMWEATPNPVEPGGGFLRELKHDPKTGRALDW